MWTVAWARRPWAGKKSGPNPTDRGKRGVKRSVLTDAKGVPLSAVIAGANVNDHKLLADTLVALVIGRPTRQRRAGLCLDKGYDYPCTRQIAEAHNLRLHLRTRGEERRARAKGKKARRWVVERTHSWLHRFRALLIRWNKAADNYLAVVQFACAVIVAGLLGLFG